MSDDLKFFIEVSEGGPWLAQDGSITYRFDERGLWETREAAQREILESLQIKE